MNYQKIDKFSIADGLGIRVVLWVSGCSLRCNGCQNPESWDFESGKPFDEDAKRELFDALSKPYVKGLTLSGGHPLDERNRDDVLCLIEEVHSLFPEKDIWCYTGYTLEEICNMCVNEGIYRAIKEGYTKHTKWDWLMYVNVIVDGKYIEEQRDISLPFRGSNNQRLIDVNESINQGKIIELTIE